MIFAAPWLLLALAALPLLWWLLRVTPPAPRTQSFPAIRLLAGLRSPETTAARTPWWLLALRIAAAGLVILGLAGPVLDAGSTLPGSGPLLLVMDDGWASAADWPARVAAANAALDRAARDGRPALLLTTAPGEADTPPCPQLRRCRSFAHAWQPCGPSLGSQTGPLPRRPSQVCMPVLWC